jgi:hypothetical protein
MPGAATASLVSQVRSAKGVRQATSSPGAAGVLPIDNPFWRFYQLRG